MLNLKNDAAENSVMQTISIAVSTILVAVGLMAVPNMLRNAQDDNARADIDNLAYAEEFVLADTGRYLSGFDPNIEGSLINRYNVRVNQAGGVTNHAIVVCDSPMSYLIKATSASQRTFYRSSFAVTTSHNPDDIIIPPCVAPEFYDGIDPEEIPVVSVPLFIDPPEESEPDPETDPEPETGPPSGGYDDVSPLVTITPATASVTYTVEPNSYNVLQIKLNNVNLTNSADEKQDWEIRINKYAYPLNRFNTVDSIHAEHGQVTCTDEGLYFSCKNNATGQWGNGIGGGASFTLGIVVNATLAYVDSVYVNQAAPTGSAWYATQQVTVSTDYPVYGHWEALINFASLKALGSSAQYICINDSNVSITHQSGDWYLVKNTTNYFTLKESAPRTFTAAKSSSNSGGCAT